MKSIFSLSLLFLILLCGVCMVVAQDESDPYLWLEEVDGEKALDWVKAHNKTTETELKAFPDFNAIYEKNLEIYNSKDRIAYPKIVGNYLYNFWQDGKNERGVWRRTTLAEYRKNDTTWETVLDIDALCEKENEKWVYKGVSWLYPDYKRCMVNLSRGGGDAVVMREFDLESRSFVKDGFKLGEAKGSAFWIDINTLIVSTDFGEGAMTTSGYPRITKIWKRGQHLNEAKTIFEGESEDMGVWGYVINSPERDYMVVNRNITFYTSQKYIVENNELIKLNIQEDAGFNGFFKNQMILRLKSDWETGGDIYKQGSLIAIDYDKFLEDDRKFTVIVEPDEKSSISSISNTKNLLLVNILNNVRSELYSYRFDNGTWKKNKIDAPEFGSIIIGSTDENSDMFFFDYNSYLIPSSLFYVNGNSRKPEKIKNLPDFFDSDKFEVKQYHAESKDGASIPYFIVLPKNAELQGKNPTLLYGYGGFEISMRPRYSATVGTAWLESGGVYAVANIRGGGEFGPKWHHAALKENRQLAYDDFIAVTENLIERKITGPEHLGIQGGSNGGLLMGVMFTQRPDLFNAVVCRVPLLDMKRYNKLLAGASWMGEYGNPDIPEEWAYIREYSPYHNVAADINYPKVFFNTSTRDDRVHPGHARKMAALMEDSGYDFFYFENIEGGHSAATTNKQRAYSNALIYSYLWLMLR